MNSESVKVLEGQSSSLTPATNALRIDRFVLPFTLNAVWELLGKTGTVTSFWMDKTHCFVSYSSMEEAIETRNALYNLHPNGGRLLVAEFVDPQEVKMKSGAPPHSPTTPVTPAAPVPATAQPILQPQPSARRQVSREQLPPPPPPALPPPPPLANAPVVRERLGHPPPPPIVERHDPPIATLDDRFRKTSCLSIIDAGDSDIIKTLPGDH